MVDLQKSTNGSNKIDNKEPDYRYSKMSEVNQRGTTNQQCIHKSTSQCIHESTQQSALPVKLPSAISNFANIKQSNILPPATTNTISATIQPSSEPSNNHTIIPEHSASTLLKEPGVKKKLKSCKKIWRGNKQKQIYSNMSFYYANINGLNKKRDSLNFIISECNPHIVCLVETKLSHNVKVNITGYYIIKKVRMHWAEEELRRA